MLYVFAWNYYYPGPGVHDCKGYFSSLEEAQARVAELQSTTRWKYDAWHIANAQMEIVEEGLFQRD